MKMLRPVLLKLAGLVTSVFPLILILVKLVTKGWSRVFSVKKRSTPPFILTQYGEHGYLGGSGGVKLHYVENGDKSKPLMVFIHGFPEFWFSWRYQLEYFSRDYWCVAIDNRGYNDSDKPTGIQSYSIDTLVDDVKEVIQGLGRTQCVLVGHDWGGAIGYAFSGKHPDMVSHYIVCNLPHPQSVRHEQENSWKQRLMSWYMVFFQCPYIPEMFLRSDDLAMFDGLAKEMNLSVTTEENKEIVEAYKYAFRDPASATATINYYRCALQYPDLGTSGRLPIKVPVLSIFGTGDKYLSVEGAKGTRRYVDDLTEEYLDGVSHWVQMEAAQSVNQLIEAYLSKRDGPLNGT